MTRNELHWLAGLLEGEGSFMAGPPSDPHRPRVAIQMTDEDVIARVAAFWCVAYIRQTDRRNTSWKPVFTVQLRGRRAVELMRRLRPLMGCRRQRQIDIAVASFVGQRRPVTDKDRRLIRRMASNGRTISYIAKTLRRTRRTVREALDSRQVHNFMEAA